MRDLGCKTCRMGIRTCPTPCERWGTLNVFASFASYQYRRGQIGIRRLHQIEIGIP